MISSSSSRQSGIKANKGKCWGEAPTGHQTFTKWTNRQGRGPAIEGKGTNQNSNITFRYSADIKFEKVSKDQSRNRIEAFGRRKHKSKDGWESGMNSKTDFNCVCFGWVRNSKGKVEGGDVTYLSCVPALFLLTANLFASQSARLLWPDRDLAVKWQQNILLIAEIATT